MAVARIVTSPNQGKNMYFLVKSEIMESLILFNHQIYFLHKKNKNALKKIHIKAMYAFFFTLVNNNQRK